MKTIALIIAGGIGSRMKSVTPKQFLKVNNKEIIAYTLENFQKHSLVNKVFVVCVKGYEKLMLSIVKKYKITKFSGIFPGGNSAQESIYNGVKQLKGLIDKNDNVIIHDGIRPITNKEIIDDVIAKCNKYGNGVTSIPFTEQLFVSKDGMKTDKYIPRDFLRKVSTPQCYKYKLLCSKYALAIKKGVGFGCSSYTNTMMDDLGVKLYLAKGSSMNIKLTTPDDLEMFKLYVEKQHVK